MIVKLPRRFYTAEQLAERWECNVEDINHLIETDELKTRERLAAKNGKELSEVIMIDGPDEIGEFFHDREADLARMGAEWTLEDELKTIHFEFCNKNIVNNIGAYKGKTDFEILEDEGAFDRVITAAEVSRFEREHGECTKQNEEQQSASLNKPCHPCYSEELAVAVAAWKELYSVSNGAKPNGGHKKLISDWVRNAYPTLSNEAVGRIATLVNPDKKGGASPTP
jgi:hypothetical protein